MIRPSSFLKGFTLVETLVSTFIITLVILGPLTVASNASSYARITKDSLIGTYLAQESIELLRHQQDSVYIRCIQSTASVCSTTGSETPQQAAWRMFKARLGNNAQGVSCFSSDNVSGCAYDFLDMTTNQDTNPTKYSADQSSCNTLSVQVATGLYVCTGAHANGGGYQLSNFSRKVLIESLPTYNAGEQAYNDDLRVTVIITFKRPNGFTQQIKVVDFLHARA